MEWLKLFLFLVTPTIILAFPARENKKEESSCGYSSCPTPVPNKLNVHIVPHSHDDVGWLKTVDQYYYGSKNHIQKAGVQYILDSVVEALLKNPKRRFIYVETAFFWKWWQEKDDEVRKQVHHLINNGQLEITGGAWSMNDEAAVHYQSTIDQFTLGFKKLDQILGKCARPRVGWQIDPFGHSRETASLFAQFGFDGLFFARLDWRDKTNRLASGTAEMLWKGSQSLGKSSELFTSVLYNHYSAPPGFCFDVLCNDPAIVTDKKSPEYNAEQRAQDFLTFVQIQANFYKTQNIIVTMGDDFNYQDALSYFTNLDKLIQAVNELATGTTVFYSSPACYLKAVNSANTTWPTKTDDFFPYASDHHSYWNGYFTSRPTSKRFERLANNYLQMAKQQEAMSILVNPQDNLDPLKEAIGIMQHHDAITGTEKQHVADDYARIVTEALHEAEKSTSENLRVLYPGTNNMIYQSCFLLNVSQCALTENQDLVNFIVYNPLSRNVSHYIRIPVSQGTFEVYNGDIQIQVQIVPVFEMITKIPGRKSSAKYEVVFRADNIPALGYKKYKLKRISSEAMDTERISNNNNLKLNFKNGVLQSVMNKAKNDKVMEVLQQFYYYEGAVGNNAEFKNRSSGAYIFRPLTGYPTLISKTVDLTEYHGPILSEYHQKHNDWVGQVIRVYAEEEYIEFNWIVGPIPVSDGIGKEVFTRFTTEIQSEGLFYTDSNGREMIQRTRGHRDTYNLTHEEPVAENYVPVTAKITIKDEGVQIQRQFSVLNDRAQGGSSIHDGEVELMVHRRLLRDDAFGVGEALNEVAYGTGLVAVGKHYIIFGDNSKDDVILREKDLAGKILLEPWMLIRDESHLSSSEYIEEDAVEVEHSGLKRELPINAQILTLESWNLENNEVLLRLEHIFEKDEDPVYSVPVTVGLQDLFVDFKILEIEEKTLGANQPKSEMNRMNWKASSELAESINQNINYDIKDLKIELNPMQIRTFVLKVGT